MNETFATLWTYCTAENRLVPQPTFWSELYSKLRHTRQKPSGGWEPPLPLILTDLLAKSPHETGTHV
jgi:hypothetical protein